MRSEQFRAIGVEKSYYRGGQEVPVLRGVDFAVHQGDFLSIAGQSGSGKTTLLHLLGLLDSPDSGQIWLEGRRIDVLHGRDRDTVRNQVFGFVFQFYHLLPELSVLENVLLPLMIRHSAISFWKRHQEYYESVGRLIERMGLEHRIYHKPSELSGGELQRTAIARALAAGPRILLADEPTGNLDARTGSQIIELLMGLNEQENLTIIMVTHNSDVAQMATHSVALVNGRINVTK